MNSQLTTPPKVLVSDLVRTDPVLEAFLNTLDSPLTRKAYRREIVKSLDELGPIGSLTAVSLTEHRARYMQRMEEDAEQHLSPASVLLHLAALRSYLKFCRLTGQLAITHEVIQFALKSPAALVIKPYQILNPKERGEIVSAARGVLRDRVLLEFALNTGLRASEICSLRVGHLIQDDQSDLIIHVRQGKGRKDRLVPLKQDTGLIVRVYLQSRKLALGRSEDNEEYLFPSRKGRGHGRISPGHLWKLVVRYARAAGIRKTISPHSLRHTFAMGLIDHGTAVTDVQKLLGHASLATTQKYLDHQDLERLKEIVNAE